MPNFTNSSGLLFSPEDYFNPLKNDDTLSSPSNFGAFVNIARSIFKWWSTTYIEDITQHLDDHFLTDGTEFELFRVVRAMLRTTNEYEYSFPLWKRVGGGIYRTDIKIPVDNWLQMTIDQRIAVYKRCIAKLAQTNLYGYPVSLYSIQTSSSWYNNWARLQVAFRCNMSIYAQMHRSTTPVNIRSNASDEYVLNIDSFESGFIRYSLLEVGADKLSPEFKKISRQLNYTANPMEFIKNSYRKLECEKYDEVPFYGVELEVSTSLTVPKLVTAFGVPFAICKSDSSISGAFRMGQEIVTIPASLKYHRERWTQFFDTVNISQIDTSVNTTNGMHVHIGRQHFDGASHLMRFTYWFSNTHNRWFVMEVSDRNISNLNYCNFPNIIDLKTSGKKFLDSTRLSNGKMYAVNLTKTATVEVRIFKGVANYAAVMKNLELVDAVFHYTHDCSIKDCDISGLYKWLMKQPRSKYRALRIYLEKEITVDTIHKLTTVVRENISVHDVHLSHREKVYLSRGLKTYSTQLGSPSTKSESPVTKYSDAIRATYRAKI